jgi:UPF0271 protein
MKHTLLAARKCNVSVGAHPSYPDRQNFGRVSMPIPPEELTSSMLAQIRSLVSVASTLGMRIQHVKPHGALYHDCRQQPIAEAVARAVTEVDPKLILVGQANSPALAHWRNMGLPCIAEAFADRAYNADGTLRSRALPDSLLANPDQASEQALAIALHHRVNSHDSHRVALAAGTLCIHSDTPHAAAIARAVNERLKLAGFSIRPFRRASL